MRNNWLTIVSFLKQYPRILQVSFLQPSPYSSRRTSLMCLWSSDNKYSGTNPPNNFKISLKILSISSVSVRRIVVWTVIVSPEGTSTWTVKIYTDSEWAIRKMLHIDRGGAKKRSIVTESHQYQHFNSSFYFCVIWLLFKSTPLL